MIQSFEVGSLRGLHTRIGGDSNIRLMQRLGAPDARAGEVLAAGGTPRYHGLATPAGLHEVAGPMPTSSARNCAG